MYQIWYMYVDVLPKYSGIYMVLLSKAASSTVCRERSRPASCKILIDDYAKDDGPGVVWLLRGFYHEPLRSLTVKEV